MQQPRVQIGDLHWVPPLELREPCRRRARIKCSSKTSWGYQKNMGSQNWLSRPQRGSQRLKQQVQRLRGSAQVPQHIYCGCLAWVSVGLLTMQVAVSLTGLPACETLLLLLDCLTQPLHEGLFLILVCPIRLYSVDITGRPALFWGERKEQWIWGRGEMRGAWEEGTEGWLYSACNVRKE